MKWTDYLVSDQEVLLGKPNIKGTRLSVEHIVELLAQGWTEDEILKNHPGLTKKALHAIFYISKTVSMTGLFNFPWLTQAHEISFQRKFSAGKCNISSGTRL